MDISIKQLYASLQRASDARKENNDCAVIAVSVVTGVSYDEAHRALQLRGRQHRKRTPTVATLQAINDLGFDCKSVVHRFRGDMGVDEYPEARTFISAERVLPYNGRFLVRANGHIAGFRAGRIVDWARGRRYRICQIFEVTKREGK